jgi:hypothetical protein
MLHMGYGVRIFEDFVGVKRTGTLFLNGACQLKPLFARSGKQCVRLVAENYCFAEMLPGVKVAHYVGGNTVCASCRLFAKFEVAFSHGVDPLNARIIAQVTSK